MGGRKGETVENADDKRQTLPSGDLPRDRDDKRDTPGKES